MHRKEPRDDGNARQDRRDESAGTGARGRHRARVWPLRRRRPDPRSDSRRPARLGRHGPQTVAFDPGSGQITRTLDRAGDAGTTFDGTHLYQIAEARIDKIDPATGDVVASIPAPGHGRDSGLAWAEGSLWVGQYRERKIHQIDPATGAILRTIESNRFVTGVTWVDGELWHATWEGEESDIRRIDRGSGAVLERLEMPRGTAVSGMESDGEELFYCGGGRSGVVRAVRRPKRERS
jgi:streptogramin lyase